MPFSSELKSELSKIKAHGCCAFSEIYGIFLLSSNFNNDNKFFSTDRADLADRVSSLLSAVYGNKFKRLYEKGRYCFYSDIITVGNIFVDVTSPQYLTDPFSCENCFPSFLRGAYLSSGTASDPQKDFHIEVKSTDETVAVSIEAILNASGLTAHLSKRGKYFVVYSKGSENVSDFLTLIGAQKSALKVIDSALEREMRNKINRIHNCDIANMDKTINASVRQVAAIKKLKETGRLDNLSEELKTAAEARMNNPDMPLSQLSSICGISRSGLNHRLKRLVEISMEKR